MALTAIALAAGGCEPSGITFDDPGTKGGYQFMCAGVTPAVARIRVEPSRVDLRVGSQILIAATPLDTLGEFVFCARTIKWSSASPSIATVSAGLVVGVSAGKTYIRASAGGKVDSAEVNVVATTIGSVTIESIPPALLVGQTAGPVARDTDGNVITPRPIVWRTATMTAEADGLTAVARIPVTRDPPTRRFRQIATGRARRNN